MVMENELLTILEAVPEIEETLNVLVEYRLPDHYLAGGAVTQCVWNHLLGHSALHRVKDFDVVYFEQESQNREQVHERAIRNRLSHALPIDVKNQAFVHTWYPVKFGNVIPPHTTTEDGIRTWLPALAVGVRKHGSQYVVFAPFGLEDMMQMVVRPNKRAMSQNNYAVMTESFKTRWPQIRLDAWEDCFKV